ncbi:MAG: ASCH domain-containing protein, partial [Alistipes sp.]|nr:ASCH domain-containing protein [Alistipes sp.]
FMKCQNEIVLHRMKLKQSPFEKIKNGIKTVELRLNDEKRQQVKTCGKTHSLPFGYSLLP